MAGIATWVSSTTYSQNDIVNYNGVLYKSLQDDNLNHQPDTTTIYWENYINNATQQISDTIDLGSSDLIISSTTETTLRTVTFTPAKKDFTILLPIIISVSGSFDTFTKAAVNFYVYKNGSARGSSKAQANTGYLCILALSYNQREFSVIFSNSIPEADVGSTYNLEITGFLLSLNAGVATVSFAGGYTALVTYDAVETWGPKGVKGDPGTDGLSVPIGAIVAWHKSFANTPALPAQFAECNGQIINDAESPYDGQTLPNLNGYKRFLSGGSTSCMEQDEAFQRLRFGNGTNPNSNEKHTNFAGTNSIIRYGTSGIGEVHVLMTDRENESPRIADETNPINISVVWVMRIK